MPSEVIHSHSYNARRRELTIVFKPSRKTYIYFDVPQEIYAAMQAAPSKGQFFNRAIRGSYRYARLGVLAA